MSETQVTGFMVVAPSNVTTGEEFTLKIKALREPYEAEARCFAKYPRLHGPFNLSPRGIQYMDNAAPRWEASLTVEGVDGPAEIPVGDLAGTFPGDERAIGEVEGFIARRSGVHFITVTDPATGITATSNPIIATDEPPEYQLYWGDIHAQTYFSDGLRCPEELYHFARHEGFLDIFGMADHSEMISDRQWEYFVAVTNDWNEPGEFATIVGQEWTNRDVGHRNIHYRDDWGPIVRCDASDPDDLENMYEIARKHDALLIPHHTANAVMGVKWERGHEPEHERLVEIHSVWGTSERSEEDGNPLPITTHGGEQAGQHVVDALRMGYRLGFVGGGDIHDGRPGDELHNVQNPPPDTYPQLRRQGIMGVWATELTREAIFDALWDRRCFATTNVRVPILFEISGAFMGQSVETDEPREISIWAASESPIARVDIVKNGVDWQSVEPNETIHGWELEDEGSGDEDYYYARITREDGWVGWSSPVWINGESDGDGR